PAARRAVEPLPARPRRPRAARGPRRVAAGRPGAGARPVARDRLPRAARARRAGAPARWAAAARRRAAARPDPGDHRRAALGARTRVPAHRRRAGGALRRPHRLPDRGARRPGPARRAPPPPGRRRRPLARRHHGRARGELEGPTTVNRHIPEDFDPTSTDDPDEVHALYRDLRARCPVAHTGAYSGFWALTTHREVRAVALDDARYISSVKAVVPSDPRGLRRPPLNFDAPRHTPFRKALDATLSRRRLAAMEPALREHAVRVLTPMLERGSGDIAQEFGALYPAWVTTEWLNLDPELAPELAETAARWVRAWRLQDAEVVNSMSGRMYEMARALVADRRKRPRPVTEDPASSLLAQRV